MISFSISGNYKNKYFFKLKSDFWETSLLICVLYLFIELFWVLLIFGFKLLCVVLISFLLHYFIALNRDFNDKLEVKFNIVILQLLAHQRPHPLWSRQQLCLHQILWVPTELASVQIPGELLHTLPNCIVDSLMIVHWMVLVRKIRF